ncbi:MAG: hypothetical protein QM820_24340 [Minicystis sp.]
MKQGPSDEEIAGAVRAFAREREAEMLADPRWDALARGEASPDEIAALERMAEADPRAREALALFRPLGEEAQDRYVAAILGGKGSRGGAAIPGSGAATDGGAANDGGSASRSLDPSSKRRLLRWLVPVSTAVAVAAAVALMVIRKPDAGLALPGYELTFAGGEATSRGEPAAAIPVVEPGSRFTLTLRPATAVAGPIGARVFLVQGEAAEAIDAEVKVSADGAVRVVGRLGGAIHARPGDAEIVAVVARPEALPSGPIDARALAGGDDDRHRVIRRRVRIAGAR